MMPIFRLSGQYFGFIYKKYLFTATSKYVGWFEGKKVWKSNGQLLGELVEDTYILKKTMQIPSMPKIPIIPPIPPIPPIPRMNKMRRIPRAGWVDALQDL